jgi:hypothetical protein
MNVDLHDPDVNQGEAHALRHAATLVPRWGISLRIALSAFGHEHCAMSEDAADRAEPGRGDGGYDMVVSLHRTDFRTDGRRGMRDRCGDAATKAFADKVLVAVLAIAGSKCHGDDACIEDACVEDVCVEDVCVDDMCVDDASVQVSVVKWSGSAVVIELDWIGGGFDRGRLLDPAIQGLVCQAAADVTLG